ncbi:MAG: helix-turn-helix domain-containing protein [Candidatus Gastranaerophilales bacterium]|nr:helix-turn-helix domain-containing protein [Candidatus Gastranaerophilales bacterium]
MNDNDLRKQIRILKAVEQIDSYAEVAEMIDIHVNSFYNWLNCYYNLGSEKKRLLKDIIDCLSID